MKKRVIPRDKFKATFGRVSAALDAIVEAQELIDDANDAVEAADRADKEPKLSDVKAETVDQAVEDAYEVLNNLHSFFIEVEDAETPKAAAKLASSPPQYFIQ